MQLTPIGLASLALTAMLAVAVAVASGGCGQVTGLSDDYEYDLVDGGTATADGGTDGAKADGPTGDGATDAASAVDATNKCSTNQTVKASQRLAQYNGTQLCKVCLANACCTDVDTCASNGDCNHVLSCKLDCTEKSTGERNQCFKTCTVAGTVPALYSGGVGACATSACTKDCAFQ